jgi:hypothetical protein
MPACQLRPWQRIGVRMWRAPRLGSYLEVKTSLRRSTTARASPFLQKLWIQDQPALALVRYNPRLPIIFERPQDLPRR